MLSTDATNSGTRNRFHGQWIKTISLLIVSLGLLWFSEDFSPANIFEPQSLGWTLWVSYAKDLIQPFAFYFFICIGDKWLRTWQMRAALAFAIPTFLEIGQFFYYQFTPIHYIGSFDPLDIIVYAIGVGLAVSIKQLLFAKLFKSQII